MKRHNIMKKLVLFLLPLSALLNGCAKDDVMRTEGLTLGAGDALAANTALQIADPWPDGVEDTDIVVPNDRGGDTSGGGTDGGTTPPPAPPKP